MHVYKDIYMSPAERKAIRSFMRRHKKCWRPTAIGGDFSYVITPTGLGRILSIRCVWCRKEKDVTDFVGGF